MKGRFIRLSRIRPGNHSHQLIGELEGAPGVNLEDLDFEQIEVGSIIRLSSLEPLPTVYFLQYLRREGHRVRRTEIRGLPHILLAETCNRGTRPGRGSLGHFWVKPRGGPYDDLMLYDGRGGTARLPMVNSSIRLVRLS